MLTQIEIQTALERTQTRAKAKRVAILLSAYMHGTISHADQNELDEWVGASDKNMRLFTDLTDPQSVVEAVRIFSGGKPALYSYGYWKGFRAAAMIAVVIEIILMQVS